MNGWPQRATEDAQRAAEFLEANKKWLALSVMEKEISQWFSVHPPWLSVTNYRN